MVNREGRRGSSGKIEGGVEGGEGESFRSDFAWSGWFVGLVVVLVW